MVECLRMSYFKEFFQESHSLSVKTFLEDTHGDSGLNEFGHLFSLIDFSSKLTKTVVDERFINALRFFFPTMGRTFEEKLFERNGTFTNCVFMHKNDDYEAVDGCVTFLNVPKFLQF